MTTTPAPSSDARSLLRSAIQGERLSRTEARTVFGAISAGELTSIEIAGLLGALHARRETSAEVSGAAEAFRTAALPFPEISTPVTEIVGTGGDGVGTLNISTGAGLTAASMGVTVAKHGNRSVSSKTGAADVVAALGLPLDLSPEQAAAALERDGFTFLFAQHYHPAMRHVAEVRRALATPTIFNILGPIIHPARVTNQLMGVADPSIMDMIAETMVQLGRQHTLIVNGLGLDEIALHGATQVRETTPDGIKRYSVTPKDLGVATHDLSEVLGGEPEENAQLLRDVFAGEGTEGHRDALAVNAGALLYLAGIVDTLADGTAAAIEQLDSGKVGDYLDTLLAHAAEDTRPSED